MTDPQAEELRRIFDPNVQRVKELELENARLRVDLAKLRMERAGHLAQLSVWKRTLADIERNIAQVPPPPPPPPEGVGIPETEGGSPMPLRPSPMASESKGGSARG